MSSKYVFTFLGGTSNARRNEHFVSLFLTGMNHIYTKPIIYPKAYTHTLVRLFDKFSDQTLCIIYFYAIALSNPNLITLLETWDEDEKHINKYIGQRFSFTDKHMIPQFLVALFRLNVELNLDQLIQLYEQCNPYVYINFDKIYAIYHQRLVVPTKQITFAEILSQINKLSKTESTILLDSLLEHSCVSYIQAFLDRCTKPLSKQQLVIDECLKNNSKYFTVVDYKDFVYACIDTATVSDSQAIMLHFTNLYDTPR